MSPSTLNTLAYKLVIYHPPFFRYPALATSRSGVQCVAHVYGQARPIVAHVHRTSEAQTHMSGLLRILFRDRIQKSTTRHVRLAHPHTSATGPAASGASGVSCPPR